MRWIRHILATMAVAAVWGPPAGAAAELQQIELRAGWNLIALEVEPANTEPVFVLADLILPGILEAAWSYDSSAETWARFPAAGDQPLLAEMISGRGYWVKVSRSATMTIQGADGVVPRGAGELVAGWNLLGFVLGGAAPYDRVLHDLPVRQIWTFDAAARRYRGVVFAADPSQPPVLEDFTAIEPGRGYFVLSGDAVSIAPELATALPGDIDLAPLLPEAEPGVRVEFDMASMSPGDRDIGGDGFYDRAETQRTLDFSDFTEIHSLTVFNRGRGALSFVASVDQPDQTPWLRFRLRGETPPDDQFLTTRDGTVLTESAELDVVVDRTGLPPGDYSGRIRIESNGRDALFPAEPTRLIDVRMAVPPLDGDYRLTATITRINGQLADTHNPRYFLTLYNDADGLKGIFDGTRSLLVPDYCVGGSMAGKTCGADQDCGLNGRCEHYVRLAGRIYQADTNRFTITGSLELPVGADDNPYQVPLRRDVTLLGDRPRSGDAGLGPQDLKGQYLETIRNVLGVPIYLEGTFVATRLNPVPSARDVAARDDGAAGEVPDNGMLMLTRAFTVTDKLLLSEVDVELNLLHPRPSDVRVTIQSPAGTTVVLRDHSGAPAGDLVYDDTAESQQSLAEFVGERSAGTWTLQIVDDVPGQTGNLVKWGLNLRGTRVNRVAGRIAGVGAGASVLLAGCGQVFSTSTNATGDYAFDDLIDCVYSVSVQANGFTRERRLVALQGSDQIDVDLDPDSAPLDMPPPPIVLPASPTVRIASLTTAGGAGALLPNGALQYALDAATFDIDRPPYSPSSPGPEDSNAFLAGTNPATGTNLVGVNGSIDGPVDTARGRRGALAMGQPVIGQAVSGNLRLAIGANP